MSAFLSGAAVDCGPSSVLKNVGGRLDRDFSLHQDRLISTPNVSGPSSRPVTAGPAATNSGSQISRKARAVGAARPFDLSALRDHLSPPPGQHQQYHDQGWANAFVPQAASRAVRSTTPHQNVSPTQRESAWQSEFLQSHSHPPLQAAPVRAQYQPHQQAPWMPTYASTPYQPPPGLYASPAFDQPPPHFHPPPPVPQLQHPKPLVEQRPVPEESTPQIHREPLTESQDLLAQTARSVIQDAETSRLLDEQPKLRESRFMALLQSLGKGDLVVEENQAASEERPSEGAKLVPRAVAANWAGDFLGGSSQSATAHGPMETQHANGFPHAILDESASYWTRDFLSQSAPAFADLQRRKSVHFEESAEAHSQETDLDFDEETFAHFNGAQAIAREAAMGVGATEKWGELQRDWDEFVQRNKPREMRGTREEDRYLFQSRNPYVDKGILVDPGRESPTIKGVLELEAAVQSDPGNHQAWYALGLKQQENEREHAAITALQKVVSLEPSFRSAYLALAVSYTNEGELSSANAMLERWIDLAPLAERALVGEGGGKLVDRLIEMARLQPDEVNADVQVALGVLFNSSEEYEKAEDCFLAALSVRPNDWLLYNRLGATLANSGRSSEALEFYHRALELHPNFVRALFNLGISYINLGHYPLAAQRILDALRLQHADATEGYSSGSGGSVKGVTSDTLWNTLRNACLHMGRNDLVQLAAKKELGTFPMDVVAEQSLASP